LSDILVVVVIFANFTFSSWSEVEGLFQPETENKKQWFSTLSQTLGTAVPKQATFFVEYIIASATFWHLMPLLQTAPMMSALAGRYKEP